jgi:hypothetical protein
LQQEAIDQKTVRRAHLIEQKHISQARLIEKRAREQERILMLKIRSENPALFLELQAEAAQRLRLENQRRDETEAAEEIKREIGRRARKRDIGVRIVFLASLIAIGIYVYLHQESHPFMSVATLVNTAPTSEAPPSPVAAAAVPDDSLYQLTRDTNVVTDPGSDRTLRTLHADRPVHVIEKTDGAAGSWLRIRMHDGSEGYIPQNAALYVSDWSGSAPAKSSP